MERKIPLDPRAKVRLRWIEHYEKVSKKISPTCRYFGISRGTFYPWYHRYMRFGVDGLKNKSSRPHKICYQIPKVSWLRFSCYGSNGITEPSRMSYYIKQKYNWFVSKTTIHKLYQEHGVNRLRYKKKWQRYPQLYSKEAPGDRVQVDVKFIDKIARQGKRYYQFTAIDDCTRFRVLRIYDHHSVKSATDFVEQ